MGFLDKIFGAKKQTFHSSVNPGIPEVKSTNALIGELSEQLSEPLEVVPDDDCAFVFIGNPRQELNMAWIEKGNIHNLQNLADSKGMGQDQFAGMVDKLKEAYQRSEDHQRFTSNIGGKEVVITPSFALAGEVKQIIADS
ncbi:MAG: hypothetical protein KKE17_15580 [Proteobacteria bacterium]|nr:hypothetical protein [Pseudomonadota bacterium]MBU1711419.1 hypothetical protein [Pseudomonadota bacterium]